jgi:hypothetical protein
MKGTVEPTDESFELNSNDISILVALGQFGRVNDEYNEQSLSEDFLPLIELKTRIGDVSVEDVLVWATS